jgi:hypothetical protein
MLGLVRNVTYSFSTLESSLMLYLALVRCELAYAAILLNSITSTDARKLEQVHRKFVARCHSRFFNHDRVSYEDFLNLQIFIPCTTEDFILMHYLFLFIKAKNVAHLFWILPVFGFFSVISDTPPSLLLIVKTLRLLDVIWVPTLCAKAPISLGKTLLL